MLENNPDPIEAPRNGGVRMQQKILVLEDDLALSAGLCFELDSAGYLTVAAYNCQKARQLLITSTWPCWM